MVLSKIVMLASFSLRFHTGTLGDHATLMPGKDKVKVKDEG
jgi:hypothetical protein